MADEQARLLAAPAGHDDADQAHEGAEELAVEGDLFARRIGPAGVAGLGDGGAARRALGGLAGRGGLLLGNGVVDAVDEGDEEGDPDGAGDARAVGDVELDELRDEAADVEVAREGKLGVRSHGVHSRPRRC